MREVRRLLAKIDEPGLDTIEGYERIGGGYRALRRAIFDMEPEDVLEAINDSGIRGLGGAGFPTGMKAGFVPAGDMPKYLTCNADESEPGAFKDRLLMQKNPHLLIEGMVLMAYSVGIHKAFIYIRGEYSHQADILDRAVAEALERGYLGERILDTDFSLDMVVHRGAGAYIAGEETGLLDSLEGKRANPRTKPPFPAVRGVYGDPTVINNVETLCNLPYIVAEGVEAYRAYGTEQSPGTKVVSVSGHVQRPGNYEVELGTTGREIVYGLAGGPPEGRSVKLWFPGGSSAPVLTEEDLDLPYDFENMEEAGSMLGSGSIIVVDDSTPVVSVALRVAEFYRHESCGKCVPCREGTNWTVKVLERIDSGEATPMDIEIVAQMNANMLGTCLCALGDSMAMPVGSMIEKFRDEFEEHIERARERAERISVEAGLAAAPHDAAA